jgi:thiamine biosynthesis lipoprotein
MTPCAGERRFRAMGSDVHVLVTAVDDATAGALVEQAVTRIDELERRWSRFLATSEVSRLNAEPGRPSIVSRDTLLLFRRALDAWSLTRGAFDPTVGAAVQALGYTETFERVRERVAPVRAQVGVPGPGGVVIDEIVGAVTIPPGVSFDAGGIGKGLAADVVIGELMASGASGALVNLGGDLRAAGAPPDERGWLVAIEDPFDASRELARVVLVDGALCTSTTRKRAWQREDGALVHHLVDPATGEPFAADLVQVSVVAGEGWWAEALTKAVFATGALPDDANASALVVHADGNHLTLGPPDVFGGSPAPGCG